MADRKISEFSSINAAAMAEDDLVPVTDVSAASTAAGNKKTTVAELRLKMNGNIPETIETLQEALAAETLAREEALDAETLAREAADVGLLALASAGDPVRLSYVSGDGQAATYEVVAAQAAITLGVGQPLQFAWQGANTATDPTLTIGATAYTLRAANGAALVADDLRASSYLGRIHSSGVIRVLTLTRIADVPGLGVALAAEAAAREAAENLGSIIRMTGATGTANAVTATVDTAQAHITQGAGQRVQVFWPTTNTGPATLNGFAVKRKDGSDVAAGDLLGGARQDLIVQSVSPIVYRLMGAVAMGDINGLPVRIDTLDAASMIYRSTITSGTFAARLSPGLYLVTAAISDRPTNGPSTGALAVRVINSDWVEQEYYNIATPNQSWKRSIRISTSAVGEWAAVGGSGMYIAQLPSGDLNTILQSGRYLITGAMSNKPALASNTAYLDVRVFGTSIEQRYRPTADSGTIWSRGISTASGTYGAWMPVGVDRKYPGAVSSGSYNDILTGGLYIVSTALADAPSGVGSCLLDVEYYSNNFVVQTITIIPDPSVKWTRVLRPNNPSFPGWSKVSPATPWQDKVCVCIGDSLTENGDYPARLAARTGMIAHSAGIGGTTMQGRDANPIGKLGGTRISGAIASDDWTSITADAQALFELNGDDNRPQIALLAGLDWSTVDYLIIGYGTNDWNVIKNLGTSADAPGETSYAASIRKIVSDVLGAHPNIAIGFWGPIFRKRSGVGVPEDSDNTPNSNGEYLAQYGEMLLEICGAEKIPAVDLYRSSGINALNVAYMLPDGTHPATGHGYDRLASKVGAWFASEF